ncbi:hypothetical protein [Flexithrix dorotheae]|uniref:hypothetical protein n=1 Tax=Flexithrix dorotheae TaxID=70993 RepID=UPI000375C14B|nr:hypothetical protein [Flexithrix dorotheae]
MQGYLRNLATNLLNLEVNTIVTEDMTGSKMPNTLRIAFLNVASTYRDKMIEYGLGHNPGIAPPKGKNFGVFTWCYGGEYSFAEILDFARNGVEYYNKRLEAADNEELKEKLKERIKILTRIIRHSSAIIGIFKVRRKEFGVGPHEQKVAPDDLDAVTGFHPSHKESEKWNNDIDLNEINKIPDMQLAPDQVTILRKAWEIGTQKILLQTIVQIDGDITNYLSKQFIDLEPALRAVVLNLHHDSTESGTRIWSRLFETISKLAGRAFNKIFDKDDKG